MFGMGFGELLVVLIIAVIFLGPDKIPETARTLGKWFHEIKSSLDEVKSSIETDLDEVKKTSSTVKPPIPPAPTEKS